MISVTFSDVGEMPDLSHWRTDAEIQANPLPAEVCTRCGVVHTEVSRESVQASRDEAVQSLANAIDADILRRVMAEMGLK